MICCFVAKAGETLLRRQPISTTWTFATAQIVSVAASVDSILEHDDANRALIRAANMQNGKRYRACDPKIAGWNGY